MGSFELNNGLDEVEYEDFTESILKDSVARWPKLVGDVWSTQSIKMSGWRFDGVRRCA